VDWSVWLHILQLLSNNKLYYTVVSFQGVSHRFLVNITSTTVTASHFSAEEKPCENEE
jgi:hypothetical protein